MPLHRHRPSPDGHALAHLAATAFFVLLLVLSGCANKQDVATAPSGAPAMAGGGTDGKALFQRNGCARCHALSAGEGSRSGPDLTHVGADPSHTADWIAAHIKNPKSHNPNSRMPAFEGRISDADLKTLSEYLAAQK
jgi:mono/diheme cytochrome c family protein